MLDAILALNFCCDNVWYFNLNRQHFFENKKPGFKQVNNCKKVFRMSDCSKKIFSWNSDIKENSLLSFFTKRSSTIQAFIYFSSSVVPGQQLEIETTFKFECEKMPYTKFEWFYFYTEEYFYWSWRCQSTSSVILWAGKDSRLKGNLNCLIHTKKENKLSAASRTNRYWKNSSCSFKNIKNRSLRRGYSIQKKLVRLNK